MKRSGMLNCRPGTAKETTFALAVPDQQCTALRIWKDRASGAGALHCVRDPTPSTSRQYDLAFDRPCQDHVHGVMDALERISRHDLGLDLPFLIQLEKIGNRCIHDVRLHLEMDVEWGT